MSSPIGHAYIQSIPNEQFSEILKFLNPYELAGAESVCRSWKKFIQTYQWKVQSPAHKEGFRALSSHILSRTIYTEYLNVRTPPQLSLKLSNSLRRWYQPDPFDSNQVIGQTHYWIDVPPYFETETGKTLAPSIHNIMELFKSPKKGLPSHINFLLASKSYQTEIENQLLTTGCICIRGDLIEVNQPLRIQEAAVKKAGVVAAELGHRILLNFLLHTTTGNYADGRKPDRLARTATTVNDIKTKQNLPVECGCGEAKGITVMLWADSNNIDVGLATRLPV